jgi:hypothetical protein
MDTMVAVARHHLLKAATPLLKYRRDDHSLPHGVESERATRVGSGCWSSS